MYRQSEKNLLSRNISSTCTHNMVNFGPLAAEIVLLVWDTPANFNWFRVLASLLQQRRSTEANQTLHDVWTSPARLHYIYIFGGCCPVTEFCWVKNSVCVLQVLRSPNWQRYGVALEQWARAKLCGVEHRVPPIFGRATITLGIGPHSSFFLNLVHFMHIWNLGSCDSRQEKEGSHVTCLLWKRISWNAEVIDRFDTA